MRTIAISGLFRVVVMPVESVGMPVAVFHRAPMLKLVQIAERGNHRL
jgi:hypothetical protein